MKKLLIAVAIISTAFSSVSAVELFPGVTGRPLIDSLRKYYKTATVLGYDGARDKMYGEIDIQEDSLTCVYTGFTMHGGPTADPTAWAYDNAAGINCEHTWAQFYLDSTKTESDMHHLFPTECDVNSSRGNLPFGESIDNQTTEWYRYEDVLTSIPGSNINEYSERLVNVKFEAREIQKGNTARAMFYVLTMYQLGDTSDAWWTGQKYDLRNWHTIDPSDSTEKSRTWKIAAYQQNKPNPFVIDSSLVDRCYFPEYWNTSVYFASVAITKTEGDAPFNIAVSIAIPSAGSATSVQVVLTGGTGTVADINDYTTQTLTFPAGSSANQNAVITITDDALVEGTETLIFKLRNVSGGTSAAIGADSVFILTLGDNDDVTAPVITSGPTVTGITSSTATISWTTDEASNSWVYYGLTTSYSDTAKNESDVTNHSVGLSGLSASTNYHYKVSSTDPMNNGPTYSGDNTFTTTATGGYTVVISEVNEQRSSLTGFSNEYVELFNNTASAINLNSWTLRQYNSTLTTTFTSSDIIPAGGYFVVVRSDTANWLNYYSILYNKVGLLTLNGSEIFSLHDAGGTLIDSTMTFGLSYWCQYRTRPFSSGILSASWYGDAANSTSATYGTPGGANPNDPLGVELAYFTALGEPGQITLKWTTASEINSYQWQIWRSLDSLNYYQLMISLPTAGTSNEIHNYGWIDKNVFAGVDYYYRLLEKDVNGDTAVYGPVRAAATPSISENDPGHWVSCSPNPFRNNITFRYNLSQPGPVKLDIYNISGQLVKSFFENNGQAGQNYFDWNGRGEGGKACPAGIYFFRLTANGINQNGRVILIK
ncbi:MAG: endonuclease [Candidatus Edwardsbacteria bacterium]|nr:endonuclease [Candidatus Edwardsbacteria bacterium]MBU1575667.1 endonuclease [Candidatus Edwardsbacteria bacterium]MBU2463758.1 endonuclease [Candidatus Edwardsbacteria bacterium]MBU2594059.1 endonuclease [Candidatus Edwardsbacteria bacterium]